MSMSWFDGLAAQLQEDATVLRRWGQADLADAIDGLVRQIEERRTEWQLEELTLDQASNESDYSVAHLRRLVHEGRLDNIGEGRRLKVRRSDLPRKASRGASGGSLGEPDLAAQVLRARGLDVP